MCNCSRQNQHLLEHIYLTLHLLKSTVQEKKKKKRRNCLVSHPFVAIVHCQCRSREWLALMMVVQMLQVAYVVLQERKSINDQILCNSTFKPYDVYYILYVYKKNKIILHLHHILYWYTLKTPSLCT